MSVLPDLEPPSSEHTVYDKETDSNWIVVCAFHRGEGIVGYETREDPETGADRVAEKAVRVGDDVTTSEEVATFPVYSDDVGFVADCPACATVLLEAKNALLHVKIDNERKNDELVAEMRRLRERADRGDRMASVAIAAIERGAG